MKMQRWHYWGIALAAAMLVSCSKRRDDAPVAVDVMQVPEASIALDEPDCERIARGYVPCLPFPDTPVPEKLQPPETPFRLLCGENGKRVDLFTDLHSPDDIRLLQAILKEEAASPGICLFLHPFGDAQPASARMFRELASEPAKSWQILRRYVEEKLYLAWMAEYGPPPPIAEELQKLMDEAKRRAQVFGVRKNPLLLVAGRARMPDENGQIHFTLPDGETENLEKPAAKSISWMEKNPRQDELAREFTILCKTRQNWRTRMAVIQDCLAGPDCEAVRNCISGRLYEQEWAEMEVSEPTEIWSAAAVMGQGPVVIHAWLDPDCPHSRETFFHLRKLVEDPRVRVEIELIATREKGNRLREMLHSGKTGSEAGICFLDIAFSYYDFLDAKDLEKIPGVCGMPEFPLQNAEKNDKLPAGSLPSFCSSRMTPCLYLARHAMEGGMSLNFLKFAVSRAAEQRNAER